MTRDEYKLALETIPGGEGWMDASGHEIYERAGKDLQAKGFSRRKALNLLTRLYWAAKMRSGDDDDLVGMW